MWPCWFSIDPGVGGTGLARWQRKKLMTATTLHSNDGEWIQNATQIARDLEKEYTYWGNIGRVVIESPVFFGGGGRVVAESGDLCKLAMLAGMIIQVSSRFCGSVHLVTPSEWKGQLPKRVTAARIEKKLGAGFPKYRLSNHAIDAIGIGMWQLGYKL